MAETILEEAERLIQGARQKNYGHPFDNWSDTVALWNVILRKKLSEPLTADDAVLCMIAVKLARLGNGFSRDSLVDIPGYARCLEMIRDERERRAVQKSPAFTADEHPRSVNEDFLHNSF